MLNKKSINLLVMNHHYIITINPQADREWERCILRNPITGQHPDLTQAIAESIGQQPGSHLVKVSINVEVLETASNFSEPVASFPSMSKVPTVI